MDIEIKTFRALPCALSVFTINGKKAYMYDFGDGYDHNKDEAEPYSCADWRFEMKEPTGEVLVKYGINKNEYLIICHALQAKLCVGSCGWCV